jgi:hypothetical protein
MFPIPINHPGHWQHFIIRNDNRSLTTEQMRQKYLKEQLLFEQYMSFIEFQQVLLSNSAAGGGPSPSQSSPLAFSLTFDDVANVTPIIGDVSDVNDWNTYFDLPTYGNPFTSVEVIGNEVKLIGGSNIIIKDSLFDQPDELGTHLLEVNDTAGCVIELEYGVFGFINNSGCINLTTVNLPLLITASDDCFGGCFSLTTIDLPSLTTAGDYCFGSVTSLTTIDLPSLTTAGDYCFDSCTSLTTINLPSLTTAGNSCFGSVTSLTTIDLPSLTTAGNNCFNSCTSLTTIDLPSLTTTGEGCFGSVTSLTTINLPSLTTAGNGCFGNCTALTTINLPSCILLGSSTGDNGVFFNVSIGNTITATFNSVLETCDGGNPDGDIQYLDSNNTVTITYVP